MLSGPRHRGLTNMRTLEIMSLNLTVPLCPMYRYLSPFRRPAEGQGMPRVYCRVSDYKRRDVAAKANGFLLHISLKPLDCFVSGFNSLL